MTGGSCTDDAPVASLTSVPPHLDARAIEPGTELDADVVIVGAGPAGITLARELAGSGHPGDAPRERRGGPGARGRAPRRRSQRRLPVPPARARPRARLRRDVEPTGRPIPATATTGGSRGRWTRSTSRPGPACRTRAGRSGSTTSSRTTGAPRRRPGSARTATTPGRSRPSRRRRSTRPGSRRECSSSGRRTSPGTCPSSRPARTSSVLLHATVQELVLGADGATRGAARRSRPAPG